MTDATTMTACATTTPAINAIHTTTTVIEAPRMTFGIDLGDRHSHLCGLDAGGTIVEEGRLQTTADGFRQRFSGAHRLGSRSRSGRTRRGSARC